MIHKYFISLSVNKLEFIILHDKDKLGNINLIYTSLHVSSTGVS